MYAQQQKIYDKVLMSRYLELCLGVDTLSRQFSVNVFIDFHLQSRYIGNKSFFVGWLVGWFLFYGASTLFRSFNTELNFKQFSLV